LANQLWDSGIHEARILATLLADPKQITRRQMADWSRDFDSWDVCDQACLNLFRYSPFAWEMAAGWASARPEFVRRAAFAIMAGLAVKDKGAGDAQFKALLPLIREASTDDRNMVKKSVNWALRSIGKRNETLRIAAIAEGEHIQTIDSRTARWIASDALRELRARK
jgi:3-methyladenine DNA glycosylase AlkD